MEDYLQTLTETPMVYDRITIGKNDMGIDESDMATCSSGASGMADYFLFVATTSNQSIDLEGLKEENLNFRDWFSGEALLFAYMNVFFDLHDQAVEKLERQGFTM